MANGGIEKGHPSQGKQQQRRGLPRRSGGLIGIFPQARQEPHQIAGEGLRIQLGTDQPVPGGEHGIEGTGHPQELPEAIHGCVELGSHRFRGAITVIGHPATLLQPVARSLKALLQGIAARVVGEATPIRHREQGDRKGHSRPAAERPLWGCGRGKVVGVIQTSHARAR